MLFGKRYTFPECPIWPTRSVFQHDFADKISAFTRLVGLFSFDIPIVVALAPNVASLVDKHWMSSMWALFLNGIGSAQYNLAAAAVGNLLSPCGVLRAVGERAGYAGRSSPPLRSCPVADGALESDVYVARLVVIVLYEKSVVVVELAVIHAVLQHPHMGVQSGRGADSVPPQLQKSNLACRAANTAALHVPEALP